MCTVTIVPHEEGFQLGCNRDERLTRPAALPPEVHLAGELLAVHPTDLSGGGTWIGVNERGLVVSVLNRTVSGDRAASPAWRCSRGTIAVHLLGAPALDQAVNRLTALPVRAFDPFTVVLVQGTRLAVVTSDGRGYDSSDQPLQRPVCFTSSSLGDALVVQARLELFERAVAGARSSLLMQSAFHSHRWADRPHLSVDMRRDDAATVSRTWINVTANQASLAYEPLCGEPTVVTLPLRDVSWPRALAS